jgi:hypothetical protein
MIAKFQTDLSRQLKMLLIVRLTHHCAVMKLIQESPEFFFKLVIYLAILRHFAKCGNLPGLFAISGVCLKLLKPQMYVNIINAFPKLLVPLLAKLD